MAKEGEHFPDVRVGMAHGPGDDARRRLVRRSGQRRQPGDRGRTARRILATEEVRELAPDQPWHRRRRRANLKGVDGRVRLFSLDAEDDG